MSKITEGKYVPGSIIHITNGQPATCMYVLNEMAEVYGAHPHIIVNLDNGRVMMSFHTLEALESHLEFYDWEYKE